MKLKHWNYLEGKFVPSGHTLSYLLTVKQKYVLIAFLKPKEEWTKVDHIKARIGIPSIIDLAINNDGMTGRSYICNHCTGHGWYMVLNRNSKTFKRFYGELRDFRNFDWDKTSGNRYIFEGTFEEFIEALKDEGFTFEEENK
jgi:hypothetical protein